MDILSRTPPKADRRMAYGADEFQFGDLWMPASIKPGAKVPVVVFFHGGWWLSEFDLAYAGFLCDALRKDGIAVWSVEYRRVGNAGGGWPGTFQDCAAGFEFVRGLAAQYPLDLNRVVVSGHSAGGHLAFWVAGRQHVPVGSPIYLPRPGLAIKAAVSLAGAVDLRLCCDLATGDFAHCKGYVEGLMGGLPKEFPERYAAGNPGDLLPLGVPQWLLQGTEDQQIPPDLPRRWAGNAKSAHDAAVSVEMLPGAGHFDVVDPESAVWGQVVKAFCRACGVPAWSSE
jgi:acetyl esterase/lipase